MRTAHDETLHLRLPRDLRAALDGEARASGVKLSTLTRNALALGLRAIRTGPDRDPPPSAPAAAMRVAA